MGYIMAIILLSVSALLLFCEPTTAFKLNYCTSRKVGIASNNDNVDLNRNDVWQSRRNIANIMLKGAEMLVEDDDKIQKLEGSNEKSSKTTTTTAIAIFVTVAFAIAVRLGGRFTALQLIGLDLEHDTGLRDQVVSFISTFQSLNDELKWAYLFGAWFVAKTFCIDLVTIVLAISAGIIFDNLFVGTACSVVCSSLSSAIAFLTTRYV
jgi:hypothetical protein